MPKLTYLGACQTHFPLHHRFLCLPGVMTHPSICPERLGTAGLDSKPALEPPGLRCTAPLLCDAGREMGLRGLSRGGDGVMDGVAEGMKV